jgi:hypothetical protein
MALPSRLKDDHFKPKARLRSYAHCTWVREHHCSVPGCQLMPIETAHVRRGGAGGTGMKPSDAFTISLCRDHHAEQHRVGELTFEQRHGISMFELANEFYRRSPHRGKLDDPYRFAPEGLTK